MLIVLYSSCFWFCALLRLDVFSVAFAFLGWRILWLNLLCMIVSTLRVAFGWVCLLVVGCLRLLWVWWADCLLASWFYLTAV